MAHLAAGHLLGGLLGGGHLAAAHGLGLGAGHGAAAAGHGAAAHGLQNGSGGFHNVAPRHSLGNAAGNGVGAVHPFAGSGHTGAYNAAAGHGGSTGHGGAVGATHGAVGQASSGNFGGTTGATATGDPASSSLFIPLSLTPDSKSNSDAFIEPILRSNHILQPLRRKVWLYGGFIDKKTHPHVTFDKLASEIKMFDPYTELWTSKQVGGEIPPAGVGGAASAVLNNDLYTFGGKNVDGSLTNDLHRLDTETLYWHKLSPQNPHEGPMPKTGCGMIAFGNSLGVFGGSTTPDSKLDAMEGRTNEFHLFDINTAEWNSIPPTGDVPPPCSHFTLTQIDQRTAVLFGGYVPGIGIVNSVYIIDLWTMNWTKLNQPDKHAACCLNFGSDHPQLVVTGGLGGGNKVFADAWLLDIRSGKWNEIAAKLVARNAHSIAAVTPCPGVSEVVMFGGSSTPWNGPHNNQTKLARTGTLLFENDGYDWILRSQANRSKLSTLDRISAKTAFFDRKQRERERRESEERMREVQQEVRRLQESRVQERDKMDKKNLTELEWRLQQTEIREFQERERAQKAEETMQQERERCQLAETRADKRITDFEERSEKRAQEASEVILQERTRAHDAEVRAREEKDRALAAEERVKQVEREREKALDALQKAEARATELQERLFAFARTIQIEGGVHLIKDTKEEMHEYPDCVVSIIRKEVEERIEVAEKSAQGAVEEAEHKVIEAQNHAQNLEEKLASAENVAIRYHLMLEQANSRARLSEQRRREAEEKTAAAEERVTEVEVMLQQAEGVSRESDESREIAEERLRNAEQRAQEETERVQRAETRINDLQRSMEDYDRREQERRDILDQQAITQEQKGPSWGVTGEELQLTEETLGRGGWAEVKVAYLKVAAKCLHGQLDYEYHHNLFQREMSVAARVSHPNLLRFLGARLHGGMAILTEFMPTSLRAEIDRGHRNPEERLSRELIISIATDVACALNYLHHMTPDPIIHRDLSSANVLLQPTPNGGWLAKVSDYGSANFLRQLRTENPGNPVYTAPESHNPALQSPKMDIYSFGVLLIEMCTCQFPVPERRAELIDTIEQPRLVQLIRQCLNADRERRPTAAQVIQNLGTL